MSDKQPQPAVPAAPWWTYGHLWLVLAGPALVVVAGFVTLYLAVSRPDPVVGADTHQRDIESTRTLPADPASLAPAVQARNHAATGMPPPPAGQR